MPVIVLPLVDTSCDLDIIEREMGMPVEQLLTPLTRFRLQRPRHPFAIDNGAFSAFNHRKFLNLLRLQSRRKAQCLFVAAPDAVADAHVTNVLYSHWQPMLRGEGWRVAYVAQDGVDASGMPAWDALDCLFIGGTDRFKESRVVHDLIVDALARGKHVHVGRVTSIARFQSAALMGVTTVDGTGFARYSKDRKRIGQAACQQGMFRHG